MGKRGSFSGLGLLAIEFTFIRSKKPLNARSRFDTDNQVSNAKLGSKMTIVYGYILRRLSLVYLLDKSLPFILMIGA